MSTCPRLLYSSNCPPGDSVIEVLFAATRSPFDGFNCDATGRDSPAGYVVMNVDAAVARVAVRFTSIAVTPLGIEQSPFVPNTSNVSVSAGPTGRRNGPFGSPGRVSTNRHGAIGVTTDSTSSIARTRPIPPEPSVTATAAPTAAQRLRLTPRCERPLDCVRSARPERLAKWGPFMLSSSATPRWPLRGS